jgi:hypothetical protein
LLATILITTLQFLLRPSGVLFLAIGFSIPNPEVATAALQHPALSI